jgi:hypothetical protein
VLASALTGFLHLRWCHRSAVRCRRNSQQRDQCDACGFFWGM